MTLDEAIAHAREVAQDKIREATYNFQSLVDYYDECEQCAKEHEQLAEWMEELKTYREVGTVEECRAAVEKQMAKTPTYEGDGYAPDGTFVWDEWLCPHCESRFEVDYDDYDYCPNCGQKIDWRERE